MLKWLVLSKILLNFELISRTSFSVVLCWNSRHNNGSTTLRCDELIFLAFPNSRLHLKFWFSCSTSFWSSSKYSTVKKNWKYFSLQQLKSYDSKKNEVDTRIEKVQYKYPFSKFVTADQSISYWVLWRNLKIYNKNAFSVSL